MDIGTKIGGAIYDARGVFDYELGLSSSLGGHGPLAWGVTCPDGGRRGLVLRRGAIRARIRSRIRGVVSDPINRTDKCVSDG